MAHVFEKKWRSADVRLREDADFSSLLLNERVLEGLAKAGFKKPSPIQVEAIPPGRFGKDLMVQAKSGTGKTLVFVIIALEHLKRKLFRPQVLVVVPTREIANQVCSVVKAVGSKFHKLTCNSFIGGLPLFEDQEKAVMTQIVVGTPGRLKQLIQLKSLPTNSIRHLIFDEADELLYANSFKDDIEEIYNALPDDKQVIATSATFNPKVRKMMSRYLCDPYVVRLNPKHLALLGMVHYAEIVPYCPMPVILYRSKLEVLEKILKTVKFAQCLLFCNGIQKVEILYKDIRKFGFSTAFISSAKEQCERVKAMEKLKRFKCKVLVSSDLTARGIDAENVDLVINFDLAFSTEIYMHRVGRAGRYGSIGAAVSIIDDGQIGYLQKIEKEGAFKAFKLPDPIPKDLILNAYQDELVTEELNLANSKDEKSRRSFDINWYGFGNDDFEVVNPENIQEKDVCEINIDIGTGKHASLEVTAATSLKSHDGIAKDTIESEIHLEKEDMNGKVLLKNENIETLDLNDQTPEAKENSEKLNTNKNSDLLNECDTNEFNNNESSEKFTACDIQENPVKFCVENVFEKQDLVCDNIERNVQLISDLSSNVSANLENDFESDAKKSNEIRIDNELESSEPRDIVKNVKDDLVDCVQESSVTSSDSLKNVIYTFLNGYESDKRLDSMKSKGVLEKSSLSVENSGEKLITIDMINNLNSQKHEFFYKTLKKYQDNKDCSSLSKNEEDNKENNDQKSNLVNEEINIVHEILPENLEFESKKPFSDKPNYESTPQYNGNNKQASKIPTDEGEYQPQVENKLVGLFHEMPDQTDSDDSFSSHEVSDVAKQSSSIHSESNSSLNESRSSSSPSDSGSQSSMSDSEEDSDSESDNSDSSSSTTASSEDEDAENIYHHNYSRTGRQNPSLVSRSRRNEMRNDRVYYHRYFQDPKCACCGKTVRGRKPVRKPTRGRNMPCDRAPYFGSVENTPYHCNPSSGRRGKSCPSRAFQSRNELSQSFVDHNVTQPCLPREHSRCHRYRHSLSNIAKRGKCRKRGGHHIRGRSSVHHHTLNCFLPSEHRCHPNTPDYACEQGHWCQMWYEAFYNQWLFIESVSK